MQFSQEITTSLSDQINDAHRRCVACDAGIIEASVKKINVGRECGILLEMAKESKRPHEWQEWLKTHIEFSETSADQYLFVSRKLKDGPMDASNHQMVFAFQKPLAIATGELAAPDGHGEQEKHTPNFLSYVAKQLNAFKGEYEKQIRRNPIENWSYAAQEQFLVQLKPVADDLNHWLQTVETLMSKSRAA
jgi:hypothetical protein